MWSLDLIAADALEHDARRTFTRVQIERGRASRFAKDVDFSIREFGRNSHINKSLDILHRQRRIQGYVAADCRNARQLAITMDEVLPSQHRTFDDGRAHRKVTTQGIDISVDFQK